MTSPSGEPPTQRIPVTGPPGPLPGARPRPPAAHHAAPAQPGWYERGATIRAGAQLVPLAKPRYPVTAKAHGAWLGAGAGSAIAAELVGLIQTYLTHSALPAPDVQLIYTIVPALVAFIGAYLAPHEARPGDN